MGTCVYGITHTGPFKLAAIQCEVVKPLNFSDRWIYSAKTDQYYSTDAFGPTLSQGVLTGDEIARFYYGPYFAHTACVYRKTDKNITAAFTRLSCDPNDGKKLSDNQIRLLSNDTMPRCVKRMRDALRKHIAMCHDQEHVDLNEMILIYADIPHPKRKLRLQAALEIVQNNLYSIRSYRHLITLIDRVVAKFKTLEWAKPGKFPRLIADLSVVGSLLGGFAYDRIKTYLSSFEHRNVKYAKRADYETMRDVFRNLISPSDYSFAYYSDDSCLSFRQGGDVCKFNMDISCCDGSHTKHLFRFIESCIPVPALATIVRGVHDQLGIDLTIVNAAGRKVGMARHNRKSVYALSLYSGSTATTMTNNMANLIMGVVIAEKYRRRSHIKPNDIITSAAECGYNVTLEECAHNAQLQFLKHSPNEHGEPWLNLGVILRTLGNAKGREIPKKGSVTQRGQAFQCDLVAGFVHAGDNAFTRMLAEKYPSGTPYSENFTIQENLQQSCRHVQVSVTDIVNRYDIQPDVFEELVTLYKSAKFGDCVRCRASDAIFAKDYGYPAAP